MTPTLSQTRDYYAFSVPLTFHHIGTFLYSRVDLLMVGFFLTGSSVGIYRIAALLAGFLAVPLTGFNQLFPPIASRLYRNGEREELEQVYSAVTRWIFTLSLLPGCIALVYTNEILLVFGEGFTMGSVVMILFVIGQLINSVAGPSAYLLMMTDHEYLTTLNQVTFGLLNVVLNYVLITNFGFIGAAIATATVLAATNILMIFEIWYLEGLLPYDRTYIWVLLAGAVSFASMTLLSDWIDGFFSLVIGGSTGTILFVVVIRYTAVTDDDKQLIDSLITNIV